MSNFLGLTFNVGGLFHPFISHVSFVTFPVT